MYLAEITVARYWAKVVKRGPNQYWFWIGAKSGAGYGHMTISKKQYSAHKIAFFLATGIWVERKKDVMHSCNEPLCQNPNHLSEGTRKENVEYMFDQKRHSNNHKLSAEKFHQIREEYVPYKNSCHKLAKKHGVSAMTIHKIVTGVAGRGYHGL